MCFSATASFTSSAVLGAVGVLGVVKIKNKKFLAFALLPIIFAVQQFVEGLLWLALPQASSWVLPLTYIFVFFTYVWWPIYTPLAYSFLENSPIRKKALWVLSAVGLLLALYMSVVVIKNPAAAHIVNKCIDYPPAAFPNREILASIYLMGVVGSGLITSHRIVKVFSGLLIVSWCFSWFVYQANFVSVWCFFAAILSLMIYFMNSSETISQT